MNRYSIAAALGALLCAPALAAPVLAAPALPDGPQIGAWGFDLTGKDTTIRPGDDFFRYASGSWMRATTMPPDRTAWGSFDQLGERAQIDTRAIIEELATQRGAPGTIEQKIGDYYATFLDQKAIDARGLEPAQAALRDIARARTHVAIAQLMGRPDLPTNGPISVYVSLDQKNPDRYVVGVTHGGLGLPEREYYLRDDAQFKEIREQYRAHIARLLALGGVPRHADAAAARIVALETEIARLHWPVAKRRERDLTYNARTRAELSKQLDGFPLEASLQAAGMGSVQQFIVREIDTMGPLAKLFRATPVSTWREYLSYHFLRSTASVLPATLDAEVFNFYGKTLNGQPEQRPRWKRAVGAVDGALGEGVGQIYVQRHFTPQAKQQMLELVENLRAAYRKRITAVPWMTNATKQAALEKLTAFRPKIGYPDKWRDYSGLEVRSADAFGNMLRAMVFDWQVDLARLPKPTDRDEWFMTPQTVNAYYNPIFNEIVFPAAILRPPFFDPKADAAVNYGAIGAVIGHEMGHGFDDQGSKSDARGVLRDWWNGNDREAFGKIVERLATQYSGFEALPGLKLNGRLTVGENLGDLGGVSIALEAYLLSLHGAAAPVVDALSGEQRFFLGYSQVWRTLYRDERLRNQVMTGPHSPAEFRVNGVVRNIDAWYEAFDVKPDNKLYLPPEQRVRIW
jgi:putative endopeptidase